MAVIINPKATKVTEITTVRPGERYVESVYRIRFATATGAPFEIECRERGIQTLVEQIQDQMAILKEHSDATV